MITKSLAPVRPFLLAATFVLAALIPSTAHAGIFAYSYTFGVGDIVTGTFVGTQNGNLIADISDATVLLNGISIGDAIYTAGFSIPHVWGPTADGLAVVSIDGTQNNFVFSASDLDHGGNWLNGEIASLSYPGWSGMAGTWNGKSDFDVPMNISWSVRNISSIPDTGATAAVLGVSLIGLAALRRRIIS